MKKFVFSLMMFGFLFLGISNESATAQITPYESTEYHFQMMTNLPADYVLPTFWIKMTWAAGPEPSAKAYSRTRTFEKYTVDQVFTIVMKCHNTGIMSVETNLFDVLPGVQYVYLPANFTPVFASEQKLYIGFSVNTGVR